MRLNKLSLLAAREKLDAANEWIEAFTEADEKLVVFCRHREIGSALQSAHASAALATGELTADCRSEEVARFQQDPGCRLIVGSLDAAGVGLTLTAASNVAFVEMGWSPATQDQAEDRVHRIGQASAVTAWYLLAPGTIDERIAAVVDRKRRLVRAASDGGTVDDEGTVIELLEWAAGQPGAGCVATTRQPPRSALTITSICSSLPGTAGGVRRRGLIGRPRADPRGSHHCARWRAVGRDAQESVRMKGVVPAERRPLLPLPARSGSLGKGPVRAPLGTTRKSPSS